MKIIKTNNLNNRIYQDSLKIRKIVFVKEQNVPIDLEIDNNEEIYTHYVGYDNEIPVVTARSLRTSDNSGWHIQRVATLKEYRHKGLGKQLLDYIEQQAKMNNITYLELSAQDQAQPFYLKLGYEVTSKQFLDAGIKHHNMKKTIN
ncbi:GNAT family N-acetyltransferase [Bombilactobacillus thymidiniphilus]|uniref:GNAT family N-acetyltransferase n=1 Tax=Bombilactobacillus thymidiniphilus TaxID=2923363 RepID=A0ABY4PF27_9LACO|nr:GNAT family N-acetyltransferase [Bombilactobacillus thymidiniphilus]UQS84365.1 GNAT family N-acetyltransferase [Bombilactobacillus thymidiniphilus]